ncbi:MAG: TatD family hydrolase [Marinilabilia sp.]
MQYINFHTHLYPDDLRSTKAIISCVAPEPLPKCPENVWFSYGIHPWYLQGHDTSNLLKTVEINAKDPCVLAIGEAGLDKIKGPSFDLQEKIFCRQIDISEKTGKPLIIHSVKANHEILHLRKTLKPRQSWILHGFSGHPQEAEQLVSSGFLLSFGPKILFHDGKAEASFRQVPEGHFFLETDHSNKSIKALYEKGAAIRGTTQSKLMESINRSFTNLFDLSDGMAGTNRIADRK